MPPVIRKTSLYNRITSYPFDLLLALNELDIDIPLPYVYSIGGLCNLLLFWARYNSKNRADEIFKDRSGWHKGSMQTVSWFLAGLCFVNCICAYSKSRTYRLFEKEEEPTTPNAKLVSVDNSPGQFLREIVGKWTPNRETVWEIKTWDPEMFSLAIFWFRQWYLVLIPSTFSPLHVLNIWLHTVTFTLFKNALLSAMLLTLTYLYETKLKDKSLIAAESFREYNSKFVSPRLAVTKRDVGIATDGSISISSPSLPRPGTRVAHSPLRRNTESPLRMNREWENNPRPFTANSTSPIKSPFKLRPAGYTSSKPENLVPIKSNIWSEVYAPSPLTRRGSFYG